MRKESIVAAIIVALTIGGGTAVLGGIGPAGDHRPRPGVEMGPGGFYARMARVLKLTDAQQEQVKSVVSAEKVVAEPFFERLRQNRELLMQAGELATFDEASVRSIAAKVAEIETELAVIRVRTHSRIHALLTAEQREMAKNLRQDLERPPNPPETEGAE